MKIKKFPHMFPPSMLLVTIFLFSFLVFVSCLDPPPGYAPAVEGYDPKPHVVAKLTSEDEIDIPDPLAIVIPPPTVTVKVEEPKLPPVFPMPPKEVEPKHVRSDCKSIKCVLKKNLSKEKEITALTDAMLNLQQDFFDLTQACTKFRDTEYDKKKNCEYNSQVQEEKYHRELQRITKYIARSQELPHEKEMRKKLKKRALILTNLQNDFVPPLGPMKVADTESVIGLANIVRSGFPFDMFYFVQDYHPVDHYSFADNNVDFGAMPFQELNLASGKRMMWPTHAVADTFGANFHSRLDIYRTDKIIQVGTHKDADSFSAFWDSDRKYKSDLEDDLHDNDIVEVFIMGVATEFMVGNTAVDALASGFKTFVIEDACRGANATNADIMLQKLKGMGVKLITSHELMGPMQVQARKYFFTRTEL